MPKKILLVPFKGVDLEAVSFLEDKLPSIFNLSTELHSILPLPPAYNPQRGQYLSFPFLEALLPLKKEDKLILGITEVDLYAPHLNFIFGQADIGRNVAVISLFRLHPSFYGLPEDKDLFLERTLKEAVHELGHLYGLPHCSNPYCVMHFSNSIRDTDIKGFNFCEACKKRLK